MAFTFREAVESDIDRIVSIETASMSNPWTYNSYLEAVDSEHAFILVAEESGDVAGFSVFYLTPPECELPDIVVAESYRGKGLGTLLLNESIHKLEALGMDTIFLEVRESNTPARALYNKIGFTEIGKRKYFYSNPIEDAICMSFNMAD